MGSQMRMEAILRDVHPELGEEGQGRNRDVATILVGLRSVGDMLSDASSPYLHGEEGASQLIAALLDVRNDLDSDIGRLAELLSEEGVS